MASKDAHNQYDPANSCTNEPLIDSLSKAIARGASRRTVLKMMAGGFATMLGFGLAGCADPNRQTKPTTIGGGNANEIAACPACGACTLCTSTNPDDVAMCSACTQNCMTADLCLTANRDAGYRQLANYLIAQGYAPEMQTEQQDGISPVTSHAVASFTFNFPDGTRSVTTLNYSHAQQPDHTAFLLYLHTQSPNRSFPCITRYHNENFLDLIYVDSKGVIQTATPQVTPLLSPSPTPTGHAMRLDHAALGGVSGLALINGMLPEQPLKKSSCDYACDAFCGPGIKFMCSSLAALACTAFIEAPPILAICIDLTRGACQAAGGEVGPSCVQTCYNKVCTCDSPCDACSLCVGNQCISKCGPGTVCCKQQCMSADDAIKNGCAGCVICGSTQKIYYDAEDCQADCPDNLGTFGTDICGPAICPNVA